MDDSPDKSTAEVAGLRMPRATEPPRMISEAAEQRAETAAAAQDDRNPIFDTLVRDEGDLEGLVAYALYKQNKRDWLVAFSRSHGRTPDEREIASYILGERTPRRIETYRRLASDALAARSGARPATPGPGNGARPGEVVAPAAAKVMPVANPATRPGGSGAPASAPRSSGLVTLVSIAVVALVLAYLAYRFGGLVLGR